MKLLLILKVVLLSSFVHAKRDISQSALVENMARAKWEELMAPQYRKAKMGDPKFVSWSLKISPPIPNDWPLGKERSVTYYLSARGVNFGEVRDGEIEGSVWGSFSLELKDGAEPKFNEINDRIERKGIVGVRPLTDTEIKTLQTDPLPLFKGKLSKKNEEKIKRFYCLQKSLGQIGEEIQGMNPIFFNWLSCD